MQGYYTIDVEPRRGLLRIALIGFLSPETVGECLAAKNAALARLGCAPNQHVTICDVSECMLQSQDVAAAFQVSMNDPRYMSRRIAFVTGSSLARMQVRRILTRAGGACFDTTGEAEAWLFAPAAEAAA